LSDAESGGPGGVERKKATVFFCHGSRNAEWRIPFESLAADYRRRFPDARVRLAFLEMMSPTLPDVLADLVAEGVGEVRVVPVFLAPGAHTTRDLPALVTQARAQWPALQMVVAPTLLESDALRAAVVNALQDTEAYNPEL
jgi:sirohydrochlorin cobaltochelatase